MIKNESVSTEMILAAGIVLFLIVLSSQGSMNEINNISTPSISSVASSGLYELIQMNKSPDIKVHQGITTDGTYFYLFHTNHILKADKDWNEIDINRNVLSEVGGEINHLGDGSYHNNKIYVPVEYWDNRDNFNLQHIAIWNATDLSYVGKHDISAQGHEAAGIVVDSSYIYIVSFYDGTSIWKYNLSDFTYAGFIPLSENIENIQGITKNDDYFYISKEDYLYKVSPTGTIIEKIPANVNEGIDFSQDLLYCLNDEGRREHIYTYKNSN